MNWGSWLLWGFVGTVMLTTIMAASQGAGLTRISMPFVVGTFFTSDRDRAKAIGFGVHFLNGWIFSFAYVCAFQSWHRANVLLGAAIGLVQAVFVLTVGMQFLPGLHPRMASEQKGPTVTRQLEPPGFLALHYGPQTPLFVLLAHLAFGAILGGFYRLA